MYKRVTMKDVAKEAQVSLATVSYVFNGKKTISDETKKRVHDAIKKLDYIPDLTARALSVRDSKLIGVVVPQTEPGSRLMFDNDFYGEILGSIEYHARLRGYHVIVSATEANESYMTLARERNLDGIIVIGMYPDEFYQQMKKIQIPIVLIDSYCNDHYFHNIRIDDTYGSYLATKYVVDCGHKDIAFFCGQIHENGVMKKRLLGYKEALTEKGISYNPQYVFEGEIDYDHGIRLSEDILERGYPITAIVVAADMLAMGVMKGLYEKGVKVPEDISVMGFDDLKISKYLTPGLTTIKQEISLKGEKAVELLFNSMQKPGMPKQEEILPLSIVIRDSVKKI